MQKLRFTGDNTVTVAIVSDTHNYVWGLPDAHVAVHGGDTAHEEMFIRPTRAVAGRVSGPSQWRVMREYAARKKKNEKENMQENEEENMQENENCFFIGGNHDQELENLYLETLAGAAETADEKNKFGTSPDSSKTQTGHAKFVEKVNNLTGGWTFMHNEKHEFTVGKGKEGPFSIYGSGNSNGKVASNQKTERKTNPAFINRKLTSIADGTFDEEEIDGWTFEQFKKVAGDAHGSKILNIHQEMMQIPQEVKKAGATSDTDFWQAEDFLGMLEKMYGTDGKWTGDVVVEAEEPEKDKEKLKKNLQDTLENMKHSEQVYVLCRLVKPTVHIGAHMHEDTITEGMLRGGSFTNRAGPGKRVPGFTVLRHDDGKYTTYIKASQNNPVNLPIGLPVLLRLPKSMVLKEGEGEEKTQKTHSVNQIVVGHTGIDESVTAENFAEWVNNKGFANAEWGLCLAYQGSAPDFPGSKTHPFFVADRKTELEAKRFLHSMRTKRRLSDGDSGHLVGYPSWDHMKSLIEKAGKKAKFVIHANDDGNDENTHRTYVRSMLTGTTEKNPRGGFFWTEHKKGHKWLSETMQWFTDNAPNASWRWQVNLTCYPVATDTGKYSTSGKPLLEDPKSAENLAAFIAAPEQKRWRFILPWSGRQVSPIIARTLYQLFTKHGSEAALNRIDLFQDPSAGAGAAQSADSYLTADEILGQVVELVRLENKNVDLDSFLQKLQQSDIGFGATGGLAIEDGKDETTEKIAQWAARLAHVSGQTKPKKVWTDWQTGVRKPTTIDGKNPWAPSTSTKLSRNRYFGVVAVKAVKQMTEWVSEASKKVPEAPVSASSNVEVGNQLALMTLTGIDDTLPVDDIREAAGSSAELSAITRIGLGGAQKAEYAIQLTEANLSATRKTNKKKGESGCKKNTPVETGVASYGYIKKLLGSKTEINVALHLDEALAKKLASFEEKKGEDLTDEENKQQEEQKTLTTALRKLIKGTNENINLRVHFGILAATFADPNAAEFANFVKELFNANEKLDNLRIVLPAVKISRFSEFDEIAPKIPDFVGKTMHALMHEKSNDDAHSSLLHRIDLLQALPLFRSSIGFLKKGHVSPTGATWGAAYLTPAEIKAALHDKFKIPMAALEGSASGSSPSPSPSARPHHIRFGFQDALDLVQDGSKELQAHELRRRLQSMHIHLAVFFLVSKDFKGKILAD